MYVFIISFSKFDTQVVNKFKNMNLLVHEVHVVDHYIGKKFNNLFTFDDVELIDDYIIILRFYFSVFYYEMILQQVFHTSKMHWY